MQDDYETTKRKETEYWQREEAATKNIYMAFDEWKKNNAEEIGEPLTLTPHWVRINIYADAWLASLNLPQDLDDDCQC